MASITVQQAAEKVGNRFDLILMAARRARMLQRGLRAPLVDDNGDKPTVIALREIEEGLITDEIMDEMERADELMRQENEQKAISKTLNAY
ncbi:MAG: DNA-directed RNA polymerase subunit omega [Pasteurellales bacterium]|nr:MAG: DNA-directed RNA polymerase subunit omega [Pasteurellales bacterium]